VKASPRPYHHGNLRQALLRAAEVALEARGVQHLSLPETVQHVLKGLSTNKT